MLAPAEGLHAANDDLPSPDGLAVAVEVNRRMTDLLGDASGLFASIERETGLKVGQIRVLRSVDSGQRSVIEVADATGEIEAATHITVQSLLDTDYLDVGPDHRLALTDEGRVLVDQLAGIQMRQVANRADDAGATVKSLVPLRSLGSAQSA